VVAAMQSPFSDCPNEQILPVGLSCGCSTAGVQAGGIKAGLSGHQMQ